MADRIISVSHRVKTGAAGLDAVLDGGFVENTAVLVKGGPGTGKTTLGMQFAAFGAQELAEPVIVACFEPFPEHFHRDALSFGWDLRALEGRNLARVLFLRPDDLYSGFAERESVAVTRITDAALETGARRVFLDGTAQFWHLPLPGDQQQKVLLDFVLKVKGLGVTLVLATDISPADGKVLPAEFCVDTVLHLRRAPQPGGEGAVRTLEVVKSRAQGAAAGRHPFEITAHGLELWPLHDPARENRTAGDTIAKRRLSTGVEGLDRLLCGGVLPGSLTLLAGMSGGGKTVLAAHFAAARVAEGSRVLFVSAGRGGPLPEENLSAIVPGFGDGLRSGAIATVRISLRDAAHPAEFLHAVRAGAEAARAASLALDALPLFPGEAGADMHLADFVLAPLAGLVAGTGGAAWVTAHLGAPEPARFLGDSHLSPYFDTILWAGARAAGRLVEVVKASGGCASHEARPLEIGGGGARVG